MSQENVEIVRRSNECRSRGDLAGALVAVHPDVEWLDIREPVLAPEARVGAASLRSALEQWLAALDGFTTEVEGLIDEGDFVFVTSRWLGKCKGSGLSVDVHRAEVYEFADGKIMRLTLGCPSTPMGEILKAVGLAE